MASSSGEIETMPVNPHHPATWPAEHAFVEIFA
jgi:hypothetical protein